MHTNKVQLRSKIQIHQQFALKCMQFATEYMLKKAQYRLLNTLHLDHMRRQEIDQQSILMAELNTYSFTDRKPIHSSIKKSRLNSSSVKKKQGNSDDNDSPKSFKKQSPVIVKNQQPSFLIEINQNQLKSKIPQQTHKTPKIPSIPPTKPTQSFYVPDSFVLKQQSNVKSNITPKPTQLDFSSDQEVKSNASSKKSKSKFQKVTLTTKKPKQKDQPLPRQQLNFKKKPISQTIMQKILTESPIIKQTQSDPDSQDSFQNFPLAQSNDNKKTYKIQERDSLNTSDFDSYHSSILSDAQKMDIHVVSQHPSENDISVLSNVRRHQQIRVELTKVYGKERKQEPSRVVLKKFVNQNQQLPISQKEQVDDLKSNQQNFSPVKKDQANSRAFQENPHSQNQQTPQQEAPSADEINNYLMRLESFEVQQQMLMKKLAKVWSKQSDCIKSIKKINWEDLKLPKPTFRIQTHQYANVIEQRQYT